jgi:hypothetical protein
LYHPELSCILGASLCGGIHNFGNLHFGKYLDTSWLWDHLFLCRPISEPWCWYIYLQNWVIFRGNGGKYSIDGAYGYGIVFPKDLYHILPNHKSSCDYQWLGMGFRWQWFNAGIQQVGWTCKWTVPRDLLNQMGLKDAWICIQVGPATRSYLSWDQRIRKPRT